MTFTQPPKRTHGRCECPAQYRGVTGFGVSESHGPHTPDCPALYPLQPQPGDEPDALTKLTRWLRLAPADVRDMAAWEHDALALISEARLMLDVANRRIETLKAGQRNASEARQHAFQELASDLMPLSAEEREKHLRRIIDRVR